MNLCFSILVKQVVQEHNDIFNNFYGRVFNRIYNLRYARRKQIIMVKRIEPDDLTSDKWLETDQYHDANNVVNTTDSGEHLELEDTAGVYETSGYRISNPLSLNAVTKVSSSNITWTPASYFNGFEDEVSGWTTTNTTLSQSSTEAKTGNYSMYVNQTGSSNNFSKSINQIDIDHGNTIASFWFYISNRDGDDCEVGFEGDQGLTIDFERENFTNAYYLGGIGGNTDSGVALSNDAWYKFQIEFDNASSVVKIINSSDTVLDSTTIDMSSWTYIDRFFSYGADGGWDYYIDDISISNSAYGNIKIYTTVTDSNTLNTFTLEVNSDKVSGSHSDFPAYVDLSKMPTGFWDTVSNGGGDIRCYSDSDLTTEIPREVVSCDTSTDTGELWVKTSMTTSTVIYIKVDGTSTEPASNATYGSENVWNSNYKAVYHLEDANDSTSNGNDGTVSGATSGATGQIGDAYDFDGTDDNIKVPNDSSLKPTTALTLQAWFKRDGVQVYYSKFVYFGQDSSSPYGPYGFQFNSSADDEILFHIASDSTAYNVSSGAVISDATWYKVEGVYDQTNQKIFVNNDEKDTDAVSVTIGDYDVTNGLGIGDKHETGQPFSGIVDEVRVLSTALSDDWRTTEYNNQSDVDSFWEITAGIWQEATDSSSIPGISVDDNLTGKYLWVKQELSTTDTSETPRLSSLECEITGGDTTNFFQFF